MSVHTRSVGCMISVGMILAFSPSAAMAGCGDKPAPGVVWSECDKSRKVMTNADLSDSKMDWSNLSATDLTGAILTNANLFRANVTRTSLRDSNLTGANLRKVQGLRAKFDGTTAINANFSFSELNRSTFSGADLTGTDFSKAELSRVDLSATKLDNATFRYANVSRANFAGSSLSATNFEGSYTFLMRVEGVDLSKSKGWTAPQLEIACGDKETTLPAGLERPTSWPCKH